MMPQDSLVSRKDKKAQRDAGRHKNSKKRKHAEIEEQNDIYSGHEREGNVISLPNLGQILVESENHETNDQESSQAKRKQYQGSLHARQPTNVLGPGNEVAIPSNKTPRNHNVNKRDATHGDDDDEQRGTEIMQHKPRFIVFIGNLPYQTTDASLQAHFQKLMPFTVRHRTDPKTKKSRGFAFLEFENYDRMKSCLKLYHHSIFDPAGKPNSEEVKGKGSRKINVELTAGGGGKAKGRKEKIKAKNVRLDEQRKRRAELQRKEKEEQLQNGSHNDTGVKVKKAREEPAQEDTAGIHPSRLGRMNNSV